MEENKYTVYRWYELDRYDKNVPEGQKGQIQSNLEETFLALLNSLRKMAEELGIKGFEGITLEEAKKVCEEQKMSLPEYLSNIFEEYLKENESNKEETLLKMAKIAETSIDSNVPPQVKAYVQCYLDSFAEYGPGARDNVVTAMVISGGVQHEGEENVPYSTNALYGCGFGKTTVSKGVAMGKLAIGKRSVITSSTPELAGQSFDGLKKGFAQRKISVLYYSEGKAILLDKEGQEKTLKEYEIEAAFENAEVIVSDLTALVRAKEAGKYKQNRDRDSLLQDEQDSDMFHNLWSVEIKGKEYSDEEHNLRISARKKADALVQIFINNNQDKISGNKVKQSVSIDGRPPKIEIEGESVKFEGISIGVPDGIEPIEFAEFIMDSLLARGLYTDKGIDYAVKDDKIESISPSTGGINDIPEGVIQALAIKERIEEVQPEKRLEKVVSKMTFLKEMFAEISGMSATYGMDPKQFLKVVSEMGLSQDLIEVMQLEKKTRLPNLENLTEEEKKPVICKENSEKEIDLEVTIGEGENARTIKCSSPQIAAIVRNIEAHKDTAIIIGTDNREKTIEIVAELSKIYGPDKVDGYSSVPDEKGDPQLKLPPNPAIPGQKLNIATGKIVVGDHCIGRGVTPKRPKDEEKNPEHLIMAQMPSRSEGLLEQFLGRVGRNKGDGSVSFILQEDDEILEEFRRLNNKREPEDILEVIESVYPEKTKDAIEATRGDIALGMAAIDKHEILNMVLKINGLKNLDEFRNLTGEEKKHVTQQLEGALKYFDKFMTFKSKQLKGEQYIQIDTQEIVEEYLSMESLRENASEKRVSKEDNKSEEIEKMSVDSRYSQIKRVYDRAVELSKLMSRADRGVETPQHGEESERG